MYAQPRDINELRRLLAMGAIPEDHPISGRFGPDPAQRPPNALARLLSEQEQFAQGGGEGGLPMGSMRNEETGRVTYFKPGGGGFSGQPYAAQPAQAQRPRMRVVGFGNGQATELGEEDARAMPVDYTRPAIDIPGIGKGRYTADGRSAIVANPDGTQTKVILGYDAAASERGQFRNLKMRGEELANELREEQLGAFRDRRQMVAAGPQRTMTDAGAGGPPGEKPATKMTEFQGKALGFGMRLAEANEILNGIGQGGAVQPNLLKRAAASVPGVGGALETAANMVPEAIGGPSAPQQQVEQAQRNFINAVLRRESGAVISPQEFDNANRQYFPQPGDSPEVITQKQRNRELVISSFTEESGDRRPMIEATKEQGKALYGAVSVGTIKEGRGGAQYVFTGGDRNDKANWRKVR